MFSVIKPGENKCKHLLELTVCNRDVAAFDSHISSGNWPNDGKLRGHVMASGRELSVLTLNMFLLCILMQSF